MPVIPQQTTQARSTFLQFKAFSVSSVSSVAELHFFSSLGALGSLAFILIFRPADDRRPRRSPRWHFLPPWVDVQRQTSDVEPWTFCLLINTLLMTATAKRAANTEKETLSRFAIYPRPTLESTFSSKDFPCIKPNINRIIPAIDSEKKRRENRAAPSIPPRADHPSRPRSNTDRQTNLPGTPSEPFRTQLEPPRTHKGLAKD